MSLRSLACAAALAILHVPVHARPQQILEVERVGAWSGNSHPIARYGYDEYKTGPRMADVAYLGATDAYYAVWQSQIPGQYASYISGRALAADGTTSGPVTSFVTSVPGVSTFERPQVGAVEGARRFVVAQVSGIVGNYADGLVSFVDEFGQASTPVPMVTLVASIDVGGDSRATETGCVLASARAAGAIFAVHVDAVSMVADPPRQITTATSSKSDRDVAISRTCGDSGFYLVVWARDAFFDDETIWGAIVDSDANVVVSEFQIAADAKPLGNPDVDGDGTSFCVAYVRSPGYDESTLCREVTFDSASGSVTVGPERVVEDDVGEAEGDPSVAWMGSTYLVGYSESVGGKTDAFVETIDPAQPGAPEERYLIFDGDAGARFDHCVRLAGHRSAGVPEDEALVLWVSLGPFLGIPVHRTTAGTRVFHELGVVRTIPNRSGRTKGRRAGSR